MIKDMVKDGKCVEFEFYRSGELWYVTECGFKFPVSVDREEVGDAVFLAKDRAMLYMRYIRKHLEFLEKARLEQV